LARLKERHTNQAAALSRIGRDNLKVHALREQTQQVQSQIDPFRARIRSLVIAEQFGNRFSIIDDGPLPMVPAIDHRPRHAALGALAGLVAFLLLRSIVRAWRWRRAFRGRTGFPHVRPRPAASVVAVDPADRATT
jgi:hypothetical protein